MAETDRDQVVEGLRRENARLRHLLDQKGVPSSLRHQVRNTLGLMRSILRRSAETSTTVNDLAAHVEGRFDALLRAQTLLIAGSDEKAELHSLIANELLAHTIHEGERVALDGPSVRVPARMAELLGLAFHELVTNALKHGAFSVPSGRVAVSWSVASDAGPTLDLSWRETGLAQPVSAPAFRGFGVDALEGMLHYQLGAASALEFRPEGLRCSIRMPLPDQERGPS